MLKLRAIMRPLLITVCTFVLVLSQTACGQDNDSVKLSSGFVTGMQGEDAAVQVFLGIPFAAPPVGALRWKAPQPVEPWEGIKQMTQPGDGCVQPLARSRAPWTEEFMHQGEASEDCLYLNVWTTVSDDQAKPVLVYIHGGGFSEGSGTVPIYDGESLAKKGLVVVTINYRLGVLGYLAHPELTAESGNDASGNYGMLDQVAALEWVRDNVAAFGGDPGNVTIAGQSAGAMSVYLLTASPLASGLFHRAIVQSGPGGLASFGLTSVRGMAPSLHDAEQSGQEYASSKDAATIEVLRAMPADQLGGGGGLLRFAPNIDGYFLPDDVAEIYAAGLQNDVPMLSGFNADEASAFPGYGEMNIAEFEEMASQRYADQAGAFLALYDHTSDAEAGTGQVESLRDIAAVAVQRISSDRAETAKTPEYLYYLERGIPWPDRPEFASFHTADVPYFFNNLHLMDRPWEEVDHQVAKAMSNAWVNFAKTGNPSSTGDWPAYSDAPHAYMVFGAELAMREMPARDAVRAFFEGVLGE